MKVIKFQQGGGFATFTPIITATPSQGQTSSESTSKTQKKSSSSILDDTTFKELVTKGGLVNDVNSLVGELIKLESTDSNPYLQTNNRSSALRMIGKINELRENKELWKEALSTSKAAGGLGEVAVGTSGEVYVKDKDNKIKALSLADYSEHKNDVRLLSVAELLNEREYNPQLAGQNSVFNVADNAVGIDKITDHIRTVIHSLGTETQDESKFYSKDQLAERVKSMTGKKPTEAEMKSMRELQDVLQTPGEYYKITSKTSTQRNHLTEALNFIWKTLDRSKQQKLTAVAVMNGEQNPLNFIGQMLSQDTKHDVSMSISPEKLPGAMTASEKMKPATAFELFNNGKTGKQIIQWNEPSTGKVIDLVATGVARLAKKDGQPFGMASLQTVLNSEQGALVKSDKAYFGDKLISPSDLKNIVYDGADAARVYMPTTSSGAPDYSKLDEIKKLEQEALSHHEWGAKETNDFFAQHGYSYVKVNDNKEYIMNDRYKPFLLMYGYTAEGASATAGNSRIKALSGAEQGNVQSALKDVWKHEKITAPTGLFDWSTTYYKGAIAVPYREDSSIYAAALSKNLLAPQSSLDNANINRKIEQANKINANSNSLF